MSKVFKFLIKLTISVVAFVAYGVFNGMQERSGSETKIPMVVLVVILYLIWANMFKNKEKSE